MGGWLQLATLILRLVTASIQGNPLGIVQSALGVAGQAGGMGIGQGRIVQGLRNLAGGPVFRYEAAPEAVGSQGAGSCETRSETGLPGGG